MYGSALFYGLNHQSNGNAVLSEFVCRKRFASETVRVHLDNCICIKSSFALLTSSSSLHRHEMTVALVLTSQVSWEEGEAGSSQGLCCLQRRALLSPRR